MILCSRRQPASQPASHMHLYIFFYITLYFVRTLWRLLLSFKWNFFKMDLKSRQFENSRWVNGASTLLFGRVHRVSFFTLLALALSLSPCLILSLCFFVFGHFVSSSSGVDRVVAERLQWQLRLQKRQTWASTNAKICTIVINVNKKWNQIESNRWLSNWPVHQRKCLAHMHLMTISSSFSVHLQTLLKRNRL